MDDMLRKAKRATVGRNALSMLALVFLIASFAFWGVLHWQVFVGATRQIPQIVVALVMTIIYAFALPLLLSMLIPTTPAGQMLQKTQWRTLGFPVIIGCAGFLAFHARNLMMSWFAVQPAVHESNLETAYTIAALIGFVVIPALAWVQVTPERWIQEIEAAHAVKKLELLHNGELAILKAQLVRVEAQAALGWAKLLPAERQEVTETLKGLFMAISDNQRLIARTVGAQAAAERALGDADIAESLDYVQKQLTRAAPKVDRTFADDAGHQSPVETIDLHQGAPVNQASQPFESRRDPAAPRSAPQRYAAEYATANQRLEPLFTVRQVAKMLGDAPERTARDVVDAWHAQGWVEPGNIKGQWRFLEETT